MARGEFKERLAAPQRQHGTGGIGKIRDEIQHLRTVHLEEPLARLYLQGITVGTWLSGIKVADGRLRRRRI